MSDEQVASAVDSPKAEPASAPASAPVAPVASPESEIVQRWFNTYVANSPVSRSVEAINHMNQIALPALVASLEHKG